MDEKSIIPNTRVRLISRFDAESYEFGEVDRVEVRLDGKEEYHISLDGGGMTTALYDQLTVMPS